MSKTNAELAAISSAIVTLKQYVKDGDTLYFVRLSATLFTVLVVAEGAIHNVTLLVARIGGFRVCKNGLSVPGTGFSKPQYVADAIGKELNLRLHYSEV